ncbi:MAG: glycosyltransferase family 9 protein [Planctomycetota bacterium]|jgi:heptosyltransferase II|nr:glycosyltransferase family 9 protein [Planctomycetota bacterium]MDG1405752.1 glycosyltransferase family 9 protein [Planctomycetota bacterium]
MATATLLVDTSFLGDVLCAEPAVRVAAEKYDGEVDFLTSPGGAQMLRNHPQLGEVIVYDKRKADRGLLGMLRLVKRLRQKKYARVICSHRSWRTALLLKLANIPVRIAFDNAAAKWMYTDLVEYHTDLHEIERNLQLLGGGEWMRPQLHPSEEEKQKAAQLISGFDKFIAIAPGSIWATKRWPEQYFAGVAATALRHGLAVVLLGGPDDRVLNNGICTSALTQALNPKAPILDLSGKTNLRESYAVIKQAEVVVSNDSAPMHMAVAADVPVVAVFCSTLPEFGFAPRGERDVVLEVKEKLECRPCGMHGHPSCPEGHFHCGTWVTVESVMEEVWKRLPDFEHQTTIIV